MKRALVTGANAGLGKEVARQLVMQGANKVYLGCRNQVKAEIAKRELESLTNRGVLEILLMDVTDQVSVLNAVAQIQEPIDTLILNAGGPGGADFLDKTADGVSNTFATNVLGHAVLTESLLKEEKLTGVCLFAGTEVIRGVPEMGIKPTALLSGSLDEFISIADGSAFEGVKDPVLAYGAVKLMGVLWMADLCRRFPDIRGVSISPGGTVGTDGLKAMPGPKKHLFSIMMKLMVLAGRMHRVEVGAQRYLDVVNQPANFRSGRFYASAKGVTGKVIDQSEVLSDLLGAELSASASKAIRSFFNQNGTN